MIERLKGFSDRVGARISALVLGLSAGSAVVWIAGQGCASPAG